MIMKAALHSPQHPEHGIVTVSFPIPQEEYDHTMELLEGIDIGDALRQDCQVAGLDSQYPVLHRLEGAVVNVDELDYLAKRLDSFCDGEDSQFLAMANKLDIASIEDFIDLTFCCQQATVITSFADLEKIGKDHIMTLNGSAMPMEQYQAVDGRKEALRLIQSGSGTVTPFGVVYDNGMALEQLYDGRHFPSYLYGPSVMALEAVTDEAAGYFCLPMSDQQLQRALLRAGFEDQNVPLTAVMDELPEQAAEALDMDHLTVSDLTDLNKLCRAIEPMKETDMEKLNAVVQLADTSGILSLCRLAENLDQFGFVPGVHTPEEYGRYMIQQSGKYEYDESLEDFYDYRLYGEQRIRQEGGQFTDHGYVVYHGTLTLEELIRDDPAEQYQREQEIGMTMM